MLTSFHFLSIYKSMLLSSYFLLECGVLGQNYSRQKSVHYNQVFFPIQ